jgi:Fic family protein
VSEHRQSKASEPELVTQADEKARLEARNALHQFDAVIQPVEQWTSPDYPRFRLRSSVILQLHRIALEGLSAYAGTFRPADIEITGSRHKPIAAHLVPSAVDDLCDHINDNWNRSALYLASYALWRLNWVHAFTDGNGRTSRALSYLILCVRLGYRLPGTKTIPELIAEDKDPYYKALESADGGDFEPLGKLMGALLAKQLYDIHQAATSNGETDPGDRRFH